MYRNNESSSKSCVSCRVQLFESRWHCSVELLPVGVGCLWLFLPTLGPFPPTRLPLPALIWGFGPSLTIICYSVFHWYPWEACYSLEKKMKEWMRSGGGSWEEWKEVKLWSGWIVWEKNAFKVTDIEKILFTTSNSKGLPTRSNSVEKCQYLKPSLFITCFPTYFQLSSS